jgi:hypothetical protein
MFMEKLIRKQNLHTTALLGAWFLRNWPTVLPEDGT